MRRHNVTLSEPVSAVVATQVASGRYKDFSAAVNDALFNYFVGPPSPFDEYEVTPEEVDTAAERELKAIKRDRAAGKLAPWK